MLFLFSFSKFTHSTNFENTDNQPRTHSTLLSHGICGPECLRTSLFITLHFLIVKKKFCVFLLMRQGFCNTQHAFDYRSRAIWIIDPRTRVCPYVGRFVRSSRGFQDRPKSDPQKTDLRLSICVERGPKNGSEVNISCDVDLTSIILHPAGS